MPRPDIATDADKLELMTFICEKIATSSQSLKTILKDESYPSHATIYRWLAEPTELAQRLRDQYARAKEDQMDYLAEEMLEIADDSSKDTMQGEYGPMENKEWVNRSKLRVDTRKWLASKLKAKKYGDKLDLSGEIKNTDGFTSEQFSAILNEIRGQNI